MNLLEVWKFESGKVRKYQDFNKLLVNTFALYKHIYIYAFVLLMGVTGIAAGKHSPGVTPFISTPLPPTAPLSAKWDPGRNILARWYPVSPVGEAELLLKARKYLGLLDDESQIFLIRERNTPTGAHKRCGQTYKGIQIKGAELVLHIDNTGSIRSVFNNLLPIADFDVSPTLSAVDSRGTAVRGIDMSTLRAPESWSLLIADVGGEPRLVYQWHIPASNPYGDWEILIDANTGEEICRADLRIFSVTGNGRVFIPDPKTAIEADTLRDEGDSNSAIPEECYSEVELLELDDAIGGIYTLTGPYVNTEPTANHAAETSPEFFYLRQDDRFEEVCVYYHLDTYQRYIQSLGFDDIMNHSQSCNVNGTAEDNSWFSPMTGVITYGYGGVDDAEDADVILHEYGHAIHYDIHPGWSGGHVGAMGEGFGDYIAGSYSLVIDPDFHPEWVFTWDGHNEFWPGRWLNMPYHYPENAGGEVHDSGQLWSAGLIDVRYDVPDVQLWDAIIFQHHYYLGNGATMEDAANAILLADIEINNGDYHMTIIENFAERGFVDPAYLMPIIEHEPLPDSEDTLQVEFPVSARITSDQPLDSASLLLYWGLDSAITDTLTLESAGNDTFAAAIPGPFNRQTVSYFISASDIYGGLTTSPPGAPVELHSFYVGADTVAPQIALLDTLQNTVFANGYDDIIITAADNIGLAEVRFHYCQQGMTYQSMDMFNAGGDTFTVDASWSSLGLNSFYYYYFTALDSSSNANQTITPEFNFQCVSSSTFDDFESGLGKWESDGDWGLQDVRFKSPTHSARDRIEGGIPSSDQLILTLANPWIPTGLVELNLEFWTVYYLLPQNDTGFVELNSGGGWTAVDTVTGAAESWEQHILELSDFLAGDSLEIRFRTHVDTSFGFPTLGWYIDDMTLSTETIVSSGDLASSIPASGFEICRITPNPGNSEFAFIFHLPGAGRVRADIYNILGQTVANLADRHFQAGLNRIKWRSDASSGIYFFVIEYASEAGMGKFLLVK